MKKRESIYRDISGEDIILRDILVEGIIQNAIIKITREQIMYENKSRKKEIIELKTLLCVKLSEHLSRELSLKKIAELTGAPKNGKSAHCMVIYYNNRHKDFESVAYASNDRYLALKNDLEAWLEKNKEYSKYKDGLFKDVKIDHSKFEPKEKKLIPVCSIDEFKSSISIDQYGDESSLLRIESLCQILYGIKEKEKIKRNGEYKNIPKDKIPISSVKIFLFSQNFTEEYQDKVLSFLYTVKVDMEVVS